jgi:hypothetical protein
MCVSRNTVIPQTFSVISQRCFVFIISDLPTEANEIKGTESTCILAQKYRNVKKNVQKELISIYVLLYKKVL